MLKMPHFACLQALPSDEPEPDFHLLQHFVVSILDLFFDLIDVQNDDVVLPIIVENIFFMGSRDTSNRCRLVEQQ